MKGNIILKYLQGNASEKEKERFFEWIEECEANRKEFYSLKKTWALTSKGNNEENISWGDMKQLTHKVTRYKKLYLRIMRQAAIIIFLIGLGVTLHFMGSDVLGKNNLTYSEDYYIETPLGQMANLQLPDGTSVILNSGSSISYTGDFSHGEREVILDGEAFFSVQKDSKHSFIVKTSILDVKVYGTSFNISAYSNEKSISTTLVEGSISLLNKDGREITKMEPGENASFARDQSNIKIKKINTDIYTSWKSGLVTYRNEKIEESCKQLERWYNVEIIINKEGLADELYFGTILKNKPIDQILEVLKQTISLEYEIVPRADLPTLIYLK